MSLYDANGDINTTEVAGSAVTGLYAADGSLNIVTDDGTYTGLYHPCGALRVTTGSASMYAADGSFYKTGPFFIRGTA